MALVLLPLAGALAAIAGYLTVLGLAATLRRLPIPPRTSIPYRFAVLVPAHDERTVIKRLLESLRQQELPDGTCDVFVVADNCSDDTAAIARGLGATVHERSDRALLGKGHALRWLIERVRDAPCDAFVFLDADSVVDRRFLARLAARLAAGSMVVQAYYRVLDPAASPLSGLREAALASLHYLRPLGRSALGLSCGLKGNGMCFAADLLRAHGWGSVGLAEDVELHLDLVRVGVRVDFAPEATVAADMPTTLAAARSQNLRWEAGRLGAARRIAIPLLVDGVRRRDPIRIDAAIEQLIPPLSVGLGAAVGLTVLGAAAGNAPLATTSLLAAVGLLGHVVLGLRAVGAPLRIYGALLFAPPYIAWKIAIYLRAIVLPADHPWIRTSRAGTGAAER